MRIAKSASNEEPGPASALLKYSDAAIASVPTLTQMIRYDGTIYAHEFCRITEIKPNTLRMSRSRGKGPPAKRISNNRVVLSLRDAAAWLQSAGRYSAAIRLAEWLDQQWREAARENRQVVIPEVQLVT